MVGGIEVAWQEKWQRWLLHAHVLAIGVDAHAWEHARSRLEEGKNCGARRGRCTLRDPDEQLSYCIKFVTYHQPGRRRVPLPPDRLVELAAWWSRQSFDGLLVRLWRPRRGGRLVVDK